MSGPRSGHNQGERSQFSFADNQADATALKICLTTLPASHTYIPVPVFLCGVHVAMKKLHTCKFYIRKNMSGYGTGIKTHVLRYFKGEPSDLQFALKCSETDGG